MNSENIKYVRANSTLNQNLNQLAEECCELGQAALKIQRAMGDGQYCAKSFDECFDDLHEEMADVLVCYEVLTSYADKNRIEQIAESKLNRWCNRITEMKETKID